MAIAAGLAIANNYTTQPALQMIAGEFGSSPRAAGAIAGSLLGGYLIGLFFLVPLVDRTSPAALVGTQLTVLAVALGVAAVAPSLSILIAALVVVGAAATTAAQISAVAARHAASGRRSVAVGTVSTGVSAGILLSRFVGGGLTDVVGWRGMLATLAALCMLTALAARLILPAARPSASGSYFALLRSLPAMLRRHRHLRLSATLGALWFAAFNLVWVDVTLHLESNPEHLTSGQIGLLSLVGALGLAVTRFAGVLTDRHGARFVVVGGMITASLGGALLIVGNDNVGITAVGLALFDAGCFAAQVANQSRVLTLDPPNAGRMNSIYLLVYYASGCLAASVAPILLTTITWTACAIGSTGLVVIAAAISITRPTPRLAPIA